jgi:AraC-like DNA-binding protein
VRKFSYFKKKLYKTPLVEEVTWADEFMLKGNNYEMPCFLVYGESRIKSGGEICYFDTLGTASFSLITGGRGIFTVNVRNIPVGPGDLLLCRSNLSHRLKATYGACLTKVYCAIYGNILMTHLSNNCIPPEIYVIHDATSAFSPVFARVKKLLADATEKGIDTNIQSLLAYEFLYILMENCRPVLTGANENFNNFLHLLMQTLMKTHTLESMASKYSCSVPTLIRLFHKHCGMPPLKYLKKIRMEYAAQLLSHPDLSLKNIMEYCGYSDKSYFIREFRAFFNTTPLKYRKQLGGKREFMDGLRLPL